MIYFIFIVVAGAVSAVGYVLLQRALAAAEDSVERQKRHVSEELEEMFIFVSTERLQQIKLGLAVGLAGIGVLFAWDVAAFGPVLVAAVMGIVGYCGPEIAIFFLRRRRRAAFGNQLVDGLVLMANGLRSGLTLQQAIEMLIHEMPAPISQEFELVRRQWTMGVDLNQALKNCVDRTQDRDLELVVTAIQITRQLGGNLAEVFERIVATVRDRRILLGKAEALTAEGRMQAAVVGLLPYGFMFAMIKLNPEFMRLMWTTVPGVAALVVVVVLDIIGYLWVRKLATIEY